jgi:pimeloyl-ACP methyl ester carboxylesterase
MRTRLALAALAVASLAASPLTAQTPSVLQTTEFGKGPSLVLLSGLGSQRMEWMPTARRLLASYHVVMVDLPGHGGSPMPDPFSFEAAAKMLDPLLAKLNPDSTVVVAHGVAGLIAIEEAKAHPERQRGLMMVEGSLTPPTLANDQPIPDQMKQALIEQLDQNYDDVLRSLFTKMGRDSAQGVELHAKASLVPAANMKAYIRQMLYVDESGAAKSLRLPLMYVVSSTTWPDTASWHSVAKLRGWDEVTNAQPKRIGNSGYLIMADQPDSLAAVISDFAKQVLAKK